MDRTDDPVDIAPSRFRGLLPPLALPFSPFPLHCLPGYAWQVTVVPLPCLIFFPCLLQHGLCHCNTPQSYAPGVVLLSCAHRTLRSWVSVDCSPEQKRFFLSLSFTLFLTSILFQVVPPSFLPYPCRLQSRRSFHFVYFRTPKAPTWVPLSMYLHLPEFPLDRTLFSVPFQP